jgi:hypothetical protein
MYQETDGNTTLGEFSEMFSWEDLLFDPSDTREDTASADWDDFGYRYDEPDEASGTNARETMSLLSENVREMDTLSDYRLGLETYLLDGVTIPPVGPQSEEEFSDMLKSRHDVIDRLSAYYQGRTFGEINVHKMSHETIHGTTREMWEQIHLSPSYPLIKNQTPDWLCFRDEKWVIFDVTVSERPEMAYARKAAKYETLSEVLRSTGYSTTLEVLLVHSNETFGVESLDHLDTIAPQDRPTLANCIMLVMSRFSGYVAMYRANPEFQRLVSKFGVVEKDRHKIEVSKESLIRSMQGQKTKFPIDRLTSIITGEDCSFEDKEDFRSRDVTPRDEALLDQIARRVVLGFHEEYEREAEDITETWELWDKKMGGYISEEKPALERGKNIFPFPLSLWDFNKDSQNYVRKRVREYDACLTILSHNCYIHQNLSPPQLQIVQLKSVLEGFSPTEVAEFNGTPTSKNNKSCVKVNHSKIVRDWLTLSGVNRKGAKHFDVDFDTEAYLSKNTSGRVLDPSMDVSSCASLLRWLCEPSNTQHSPIVDSMPRTTEPAEAAAWDSLRVLSSTNGSRYARSLEFLMREIALHAGSRSRKNNKKHTIVSTFGIDGFLLIMHPGPFLRSGSHIYVQIASNRFVPKEIDDYSPTRFHYGETWITRPLIVSQTMLNWYLRIDDRIMASSRAMMSTMMEDPHAIGSANSYLSDLDTHGIVCAAALENCLQTSQILQDSRYIGMKATGIEGNLRSHILSGLTIPLRSELQLLMIKRLKEFTIGCISGVLSTDNLHRSIFWNEETGDIDDTFAIAQDKIPMMLSRSENRKHYSLRGFVSEMYYCILHDKDQSNKLYDSRSIMKKIVKLELKLDECVRSTDSGPTGFPDVGESEREFIERLGNSPNEWHLFSARSMATGMKLLLKHQGHKHGEETFSRAVSHPRLTKTLDEFATFKASAVDAIDKIDENSDIDELLAIRHKCVENVDALTKGAPKECYSLGPMISDLIEKLEVKIQLFKKNQIGGVREILILTMQSRLCIYYVESIARGMCESHIGEMLTHGSIKASRVSGIVKNLLKSHPEIKDKVIIYDNSDQTTWCQLIMSYQFLFMYTVFSDKMSAGEMRAIAKVLLDHQKKRIEVPKELIREFLKDTKNERPYESEELNHLKEAFLRDYSTSFLNESNMGQGIEHYNSSLMHLCKMAFSEEVLKRAINLMRRWDPQSVVPEVLWDFLVSSDDLFRVLMVYTRSQDAEKFPKGQSARLKTELKVKFCSALISSLDKSVDHLFNIQRSDKKSCLHKFIAEFNSLFGSHFDKFSPLIKFMGSATIVPESTSVSKMIQDSYSLVMMCKDQGASNSDCHFIHLLNKRFIEQLYNTMPGGVNDPRLILECNDDGLISYHLGVYPLLPSHLCGLFGPKLHDYMACCKHIELNKVNEQTWDFLCGIYSGLCLEGDTYGETDYDGSHRGIEFLTGPGIIWKRTMDRMGIDPGDTWESIEADPLMILRKSRSMEETQLKIRLKMLSRGAKEALRQIPVSDYIKRMTATEHSEVFHSAFTEKGDFSQCVADICGKGRDLDIDPRAVIDSYGAYVEAVKLWKPINLHISKKPINRALRTHKAMIRPIGTNLENPLYRVLEYVWGEADEEQVFSTNSLKRDWSKLTQSFPLLKDTLTETQNACRTGGGTVGKYLLDIVSKFGTTRSMYRKTLSRGSDSNSVHSTIVQSLEFGHLERRSMKWVGFTEGTQQTSNTIGTLSKLCLLCHNVFCLMTSSLNSVMEAAIEMTKMRLSVDGSDYNRGLMSDFHHDITDNISSLSVPPHVSKTWLILQLLVGNIDPTDMGTILNKAGLPDHHWMTMQEKQLDGTWIGGAQLMLSLRNETMMVWAHDSTIFRVEVSNFLKSEENGKMMQKAIKLLGGASINCAITDDTKPMEIVEVGRKKTPHMVFRNDSPLRVAPLAKVTSVDDPREKIKVTHNDLKISLSMVSRSGKTDVVLSASKRIVLDDSIIRMGYNTREAGLVMGFTPTAAVSMGLLKARGSTKVFKKKEEMIESCVNPDKIMRPCISENAKSTIRGICDLFNIEPPGISSPEEEQPLPFDVSADVLENPLKQKETQMPKPLAFSVAELSLEFGGQLSDFMTALDTGFVGEGEEEEEPCLLDMIIEEGEDTAEEWRPTIYSSTHPESPVMFRILKMVSDSCLLPACRNNMFGRSTKELLVSLIKLLLRCESDKWSWIEDFLAFKICSVLSNKPKDQTQEALGWVLSSNRDAILAEVDTVLNPNFFGWPLRIPLEDKRHFPSLFKGF